MADLGTQDRQLHLVTCTIHPTSWGHPIMAIMAIMDPDLEAGVCLEARGLALAAIVHDPGLVDLPIPH